MEFAAVGEDGAEDAVVGALREVDELPVGGELGRQVADRNRLDQDAEAPLVELLGEAELAEAPVRIEPGAAHQEQHGLAAVGGLVEAPLPALAGGDAARRVEVEEEVVPAFRRQPVAKRDRLRVVAAGMTEEDARHALPDTATTHLNLTLLRDAGNKMTDFVKGCGDDGAAFSEGPASNADGGRGRSGRKAGPDTAGL